MSGSPKSVVSSFIEASKSGNFEDIKKYISRSDVSMMEIGENFLSKMDPNGVKDMKDKMAKEFQEKTKDATYQLGEEKIDGDNATVQISFTHQGKTESHPLSLVKEDGKWKVSLMSTGMNMACKNKEEVAKAMNSINLDSL